MINKSLKTTIFLMLLSLKSYAIGFNHETFMHFVNCTGQPLTINWVGYNFNFDSPGKTLVITDGTFNLSKNENDYLIKALWTFFNASPNGVIKCNVQGESVSENFMVQLTGVLPEGRLLYSTTSKNINFQKTHIEFANLSASNIVYIGCK